MHSAFWSELVSAEDNASEAKAATKTQKIDNGIEAQRIVIGIPPAEWAKAHQVLSAKNLLSPKEVGILKIAMQLPFKIPTERQCLVLLDTMEKARSEGVVLAAPESV